MLAGPGKSKWGKGGDNSKKIGREAGNIGKSTPQHTDSELD